MAEISEMVKQALIKDDFEVIQRVVQGYGANVDIGGAWRLIHMAAWWRNDLKYVKFLVENGADVNVLTLGGDSPLQYAACSEKERLDVVRFLLDNGALIDHLDSEGRTPLFFSCRFGNLPVVKLLVERGADLAVRNTEDGQTPVFEAVAYTNLAVLRFLVKQNVDLNVRDDAGDTPLAMIRREAQRLKQKKYWKIVEYLEKQDAQE